MGVKIKKRKPGFLGKMALSLNLMVVLLLLFSYLSPYVDPQSFWPFAFLGLAYMPLVVVNLLFVLFWLISRRHRSYAVWSLTAILLGLGALQSHIGFRWPAESSPAPAPDSAAIRVLSYNVHLFRAFDQTGNEPDIKEEAIALIREVDPDLVCLQEYYTRQKGRHDISEMLRNKLGLRYQYFHPTAKNEFESYGLAIFSKYPIVSSGHLPDFELGVNSIIYADIEKDGKVLRVYNVHLRSYGFRKEDYDFITGPTEEPMEKRISSTKRIGSRLKQAFALRSLQARSLRKHLENNRTPFLILGDFNDTPLSFAVNHVGKGLQNAFREKASGWGKTYNGDFPNFQIDYILASPEFRVRHYQIIREKLSDHYPIWADLSWD